MRKPTTYNRQLIYQLKEMIHIFNFKKKTQPILNDYDIHLKNLLENYNHQSNIKDIESYTERIYFKLKSLSIYPEGLERDLAQQRIKSNQACLQYAIEEYDNWLNETVNYIDQNLKNFEYYKGYQTGDRNYPLASYEIIDLKVKRLERGWFD